MKKYFLNALINLAVVGMAVGPVFAAMGDEYSHEIARMALDEYEQKKSLAVQEISTPAQDASDQQVQSIDESQKSAENTGDVYFVQPAPIQKKHTFEGGIETYRYDYRENVQGFFFVGTRGTYQGVFANYTFRRNLNDGVTHYFPNVYRVEGRVASGRVNYTGSGTWSGLKDSMYELRGLSGYDYLPLPTLRVTPYAGLGWRYLNDGAEAIPAQTGYYSGYNRESRYCYLPFGGELEKTFDRVWTFGMSLEYDYLIKGRQISHLEDEVDLNGQNAGRGPVKNIQRKGHGFRGAVRLAREVSRMAFYAEPFIRFWDIGDSETSYDMQGGQRVGGGQEPKNTTREVGMKLGVKF